MKALIIEDEAAATRNLKGLISKHLPEATVVGALTSISEGIDWFFNNAAPEVIFMDIELTDGKSFQLLEQIDIPSYIIFVTAYDQYAIDAFDFNSLNYLLKPVNEERFVKSVEKLRAEIKKKESFISSQLIEQLKSLNQKQGYKTRFLVKQGNKFVSVDVSQIAYFRVHNELTNLVTYENRKFVVNSTLEQLETQLNPQQFFRLNRQFLSSINAIISVESYFKSKLVIKLLPEVEDSVIVSQEKSGLFKSWLDGKDK